MVKYEACCKRESSIEVSTFNNIPAVDTEVNQFHGPSVSKKESNHHESVVCPQFRSLSLSFKVEVRASHIGAVGAPWDVIHGRQGCIVVFEIGSRHSPAWLLSVAL